MKSIVAATHDFKSYFSYGQKSFLLPLKDYSVSYEKTYSLDEIKKIRKENMDLELFIVINKTIFNDEIEALENILEVLDSISIQGVFFYDLAILEIKRSQNLTLDLVWNQTHMVTNATTCNYYFDKGVQYAVIAGELEKSEILKLAQSTKIKLFYTLLSFPVVAHSRRRLVTNYENRNQLDRRDKISIHEKVGDQDYFVREEEAGTSFFYQNIPNYFPVLEELDVDYVILNESYMDHDLFILLLDITNQYLRREISFDVLMKQVHSLIGKDAPFLNHKTIYRVKKEGKK